MLLFMNFQRARRRDFWLLVSAAILWGTVGVATREIYAHSTTGALAVAFWRLAIAAPLFFHAGWSRLKRKIWHIQRRDLLAMVVMGGLQALYQTSYCAAITYAGVTIPTLIALCVAPVLVALFSSVMLRESPQRMTLYALPISLLGTMLLVVAGGQAQMAAVSLPGILLALLAAGGYAGFLLWGRQLSNRYHPLQVNAIAFGTGAIMLLCIALPSGLSLRYPVWEWGMLLYLGCIPTAFAYALFQTGIQRVSATIASLLTLCEPLAAALLAWLLFGEALRPLGLVGALLLLTSMVLLVIKNDKGTLT